VSNAPSAANARVSSFEIAVALACSAARAVVASEVIAFVFTPSADVARFVSTKTAAAISEATAVLALASVKYKFEPSVRSSVSNELIKSVAVTFFKDDEAATCSRSVSNELTELAPVWPETDEGSSLDSITAALARAGDLICLKAMLDFSNQYIDKNT
jgi:hypothetical protein